MPKATADWDQSESPRHIDQRIAQLSDWRGAMLAEIRKLILSADPDVIEEFKWNQPVWSCAGIICTGEAYKSAVKTTFPRGAALEDPDQLFNSSLTGNARRAIDFHQGDTIDEAAFVALIRAAIALNRAKKSTP
ncbi:DUF1801 domain-containing protein [Devosia sp. PTR5]|uniref:DUF1801 domain-containing protein n=1 Tax=Devosia oryzisoli TaxID=2774138 RepID=A0A927IRE7_9HYPH|nr:DUF1801 domain-containing protein [Devosia oryzisoli]MBD8066630.1 DUF1801 domain-containing protein [Devosia oryzisoli]